MFEEYVCQFVELANTAKLATLVGLILANLIAGVAASIKTGEFRLAALGDFMLKRIVAYILGYLSIVVVAVIQPEWEAAITLVWAFIVAALLGHLLGNLKDLGLPIPERFTKKKAA